MKLNLIFPPLVIPSVKTPYPSLPVLSGYLKDRTAHEVNVLDLNADFINELIDYTQQKGIKYDSSSFELFMTLLKASIKKRLFGEKDENLGFHQIEFYLLKGLNLILDSENIESSQYRSLRDHDLGETEIHSLIDFWNLKFAQLKKVIDEENHPIVDFLTQNRIISIEDGGRQIYGFSVAFVTQFETAVALAKHIKKSNPDAFIVFGGPAIRLITPHLEKLPELFQFIDCFAEKEGEEILSSLADKISKSQSWHDVPGLTYLAKDRSITRNQDKLLDINTLPAPDYTFIKQHQYLNPDVIHLRASIGCYYNKCAFCTLSLNHYKQRRVELIVQDILYLKEKYNLQKIAFCDEALSPKILDSLPTALIENNTKISWSASARFEKDVFNDSLCSKLKKSGCQSFNFGLESGCQRVNDLMNKGVDLVEAQKAIHNLSKHGIACNITSFVGFPGESLNEAKETIEFLKKNWLHCNAYVGVFCLNRNSDVFNSPEKYNIQSIDLHEDYLFKNNFDFSMADFPSREEFTKISKEYRITFWQMQVKKAYHFWQKLMAL